MALAACLVVNGIGCRHEGDSSAGSAKANPKTASSKTLWDRLGGELAVTQVVDDFVAIGANDPAVNFTRQGKPNQWDPSVPGAMDRLKWGLVTFISENTGGPLHYKGRKMQDVHRGMKITEKEFSALAQDLAKALDKNNVPEKEKNELLGVVGSTKSMIVNK
jgi:hemoglobin